MEWRRQLPDRGRRSLRTCRKQDGWQWLLALVVVALGGSSVAGPAAGATYQSSGWIAECDPECSITVPFSTTQGGEKGSFALTVMPEAGVVAIVGQPAPVRAILRIDKNPPIECREARYCLFPRFQGYVAALQLGAASIILVDVFTAKTAFKFSLSASGYRAGLAQLRAWAQPARR